MSDQNTAETFAMLESRKLKTLRVANDVLEELLKAGTHTLEIKANPIPEDTKIVGARYCLPCRAVELVIWSASYEAVPEGEELPKAEAPTATNHSNVEQLSKN